MSEPAELPDKADDAGASRVAEAVATLLLAAGRLMEDASVTAATAPPSIAARTEALANAGADIAALTAAAAVLTRLRRSSRDFV